MGVDKALSIADILNAEDTKQERVDVPEWGGYVMVETMTAEAKDAYETSVLSEKLDDKGDVVGYERNMKNVRAKLIAACVLDPNGRRMFVSDQQVEQLGRKSAKAVDRVFAACQRLNAISDKDVEDLAGN